MLGNLDKWPAIHVFGTCRAHHTPADDDHAASRSGSKGASWTTPENTEAAQTLVDWVDKGYFDPASTARATTRRGRTSARARASS